MIVERKKPKKEIEEIELYKKIRKKSAPPTKVIPNKRRKTERKTVEKEMEEERERSEE